MNARYSLEVEGPEGRRSETGQLMEDKFAALWKKRTIEPAKVAMSVSESMEYGAFKVSATVSVACDQNEPTIDAAGGLAFFKALELVRDGWSELGIQPPTPGGG
jgi:hypothetical protein